MSQDTRMADGSAAGSFQLVPRRIRLTVLFSILIVMLFALWYDYQVARPAVRTAYDLIMDMNFEVNSSAALQAMTARDVQNALGRQPAAIFTEGPFSVEVYSWVGGLPFRTHDYYAVYVGQGQNKAFMRQYMFYLPLEEINPRKGKPSEVELAQAMSEEGGFPGLEMERIEEYRAMLKSYGSGRDDQEGAERQARRPERP